MAGYLGASPVPQTIQKKQSFTATASQTTFTTTGYTDGQFINVYLNGVRLINGTDYTATNGSDIVLTTGASASDVLDFETFNEFTLVDQTLETPTFTDSATVTSTTTASLSVSGDTTATLSLKNNTHEDTDGGRESTIIFKGEQSGGEISTLAEIEASHDGTADDQKGDLIFRTNDGSDGTSPTEHMRIDSEGKVRLQQSSVVTASSDADDLVIEKTGDTGLSILSTTTGRIYFGDAANDDAGSIRYIHSDNSMRFETDDAERMRIDTSGNLLVGHTSQDTPVDNGGAGVTLRPAGIMLIGGTGTSIYANREDSDGEIMEFRKDGTKIAAIGTISNGIHFVNNSTGGIRYTTSGGQTRVCPCDETGAFEDNLHDIGSGGARWDDIFATNTNITTSDENEKQNIASLTNTEITAATAISKLFKTYKWKDKVVAKGDDARTHTGVVAQQVQTAMSDAGLDASKYAFWCSNTWWEKDGNHYDTKDEAPEGATERTRLGVRYPELLAFIGAATEQRLTNIEARLDALEAE